MTNAEAQAVIREMLEAWDKVVATLRLLRGCTEEEAARIARRYFDMSVGRSS